MKVILLATIGIISLSIMACSQAKEEKSPIKATSKAKFRNREQSKFLFHGDMETPSSAEPSSPMLLSLKLNHLPVSSTKTIGEAFDTYKYAVKKEWRDTASQHAPYYIDYVCWIDISPFSSARLKEGVVKRGVGFKFVIHEDGVSYIAMASRIDIKTDGMAHTTIIDPPEIPKIVTAIYENREITF